MQKKKKTLEKCKIGPPEAKSGSERHRGENEIKSNLAWCVAPLEECARGENFVPIQLGNTHAQNNGGRVLAAQHAG